MKLIIFICILLVFFMLLFLKKNKYENFTENVRLNTFINEIKNFIFSNKKDCPKIDDIKVLINSNDFNIYLNKNFVYLKENNKFSLEKVKTFLKNNNLDNLNKITEKIFNKKQYLTIDEIKSILNNIFNNHIDIIKIIKEEVCQDDIELLLKIL